MTRKVRPEIAKYLGIDPNTPVRVGPEIEKWLADGPKKDAEQVVQYPQKKGRRP